MIYRYPPEVHEFVKKWCCKLRDEDLAEECNKALGTQFTARSMKAFRGNHKYHNRKKQWTSEEYWKYQKYYPKGVYEFVRDNSWHVPSKEMAEMVNEKFGTNFTQTGMKQFRQRHGIKSGCTGWYRKGHEPGNKGKKMKDICSPEVYERVRNSYFKKGNHPVNEKPIGTITTTVDGYKYIKVQMEGKQNERWRPLSIVTWEKHNGPVPEGMNVSFKDSNRENCDIDNLMLVTKAEHVVLTTKNYRSNDPDLTVAALGVVRLKMRMSKLRREKHKDADRATGNNYMAQAE